VQYLVNPCVRDLSTHGLWVMAYGQLDGGAACLSEVVWLPTDQLDAPSDLMVIFGKDFPYTFGLL
jgi:hypothetical protein